MFYCCYLNSLIDIAVIDNYFISATTSDVVLQLKSHKIDRCPDFHIFFCLVKFSGWTCNQSGNELNTWGKNGTVAIHSDMVTAILHFIKTLLLSHLYNLAVIHGIKQLLGILHVVSNIFILEKLCGFVLTRYYPLFSGVKIKIFCDNFMPRKIAPCGSGDVEWAQRILLRVIRGDLLGSACLRWVAIHVSGRENPGC